MDIAYKISIPNPCHEDWNNMDPISEGRFCHACQHVLTDFTQLSRQEIAHYIQQNKNSRICGRFRNDQLDVSYPIFIQTVSNFSIRQKIFLSIFFAFSTHLFVFTQSQDSGSISSIIDTLKTEIIVNDTTSINEDSSNVNVKNADKIDSEDLEPNNQQVVLEGIVAGIINIEPQFPYTDSTEYIKAKDITHMKGDSIETKLEAYHKTTFHNEKPSPKEKKSADNAKAMAIDIPPIKRPYKKNKPNEK